MIQAAVELSSAAFKLYRLYFALGVALVCLIFCLITCSLLRVSLLFKALLFSLSLPFPLSLIHTIGV
ncbi:MAG: hypothetical protein LBT67_01280 [Holosporaceae bacterium]|nr:hypothetical protein [Holosporaceae bacterium]